MTRRAPKYPLCVVLRDPFALASKGWIWIERTAWVTAIVALAFWTLCWGVVGMVLAVPLTVMLKIVWENVAITRPLARLMSEE